jgi:hypothetical protein
MTRGDEAEAMRVKPDQLSGTMFAGLGSYDGPRPVPPTAPRVREPAPSVRNPASEAAADSLDPDTLERECRRVYTWFAAQSVPRTRHECAAALYIGVDGIANLGSACGRVNQLVAHGWLLEVGKQGKRSTLRIMTNEERRHFLRHSGVAA